MCNLKNMSPVRQLASGLVTVKKTKSARNEVCQWDIKTTSPSISINITRFIFDGNTEKGCEHGGLIIHQRRGVKDNEGGSGMDEINRDNIWYLSCITHERSIEVHFRAEVTITMVFFSGYSSGELAWAASESQCVTLTPNPCNSIKGSIKAKGRIPASALLGYRTDLILTQKSIPEFDNIALPKGLSMEGYLLHVMSSTINADKGCFVISQFRNWVIGNKHNIGVCDVEFKAPVIGAIDVEMSYYTSPEQLRIPDVKHKACLKLATVYPYKITYGIRGSDHVYTTQDRLLYGYTFLSNIHYGNISALYCIWTDIYFTLKVRQTKDQVTNASIIRSDTLDINKELHILPFVAYAVMKESIHLYLQLFVKHNLNCWIRFNWKRSLLIFSLITFQSTYKLLRTFRPE